MPYGICDADNILADQILDLRRSIGILECKVDDCRSIMETLEADRIELENNYWEDHWDFMRRIEKQERELRELRKELAREKQKEDPKAEKIETDHQKELK